MFLRTYFVSKLDVELKKTINLYELFETNFPIATLNKKNSYFNWNIGLKRYVIFPILILFFGAFGLTESFAEDKLNLTELKKNGLILSLSTDKSLYSLKEPISLTYQIENQGKININFMKGDSCDDGFFGYFKNKNEQYPLESFLSAGLYLEPANNPFGEKVDDSFYRELLLMINNKETRDYGIIITGDTENILKVLSEKHNATSINESNRLNFVTAKIPVNEILEIAKYPFVLGIGDGEEELCAQAIGRGTLSSGDGFEKSLYLSQEFYKFPGVHSLPLGDYDIVLNFRLLDESLIPSSSLYSSPNAENIDLLSLSLPISISDEKQEILSQNFQKKSLESELGNKKSDLIHSLKHQLKSGVTPENIQCTENYLLLIRNDGNPACVKPTTAEKLIERGWGSFPKIQT